MSLQKISPGTTRIGWIGTGVMGHSMAGHLMAKGFAATVYSRTKAKAQPLLDKGATWVRLPRKSPRRATSSSPSSAFPRTFGKFSWELTAPWPAAKPAASSWT